MGIRLLELVEVFNELMVCVVVRENLPVTVSICLYPRNSLSSSTLHFTFLLLRFRINSQKSCR